MSQQCHSRKTIVLPLLAFDSSKILAILFLAWSLSANAAPVMTDFEPASHGYLFANTFRNNFAPAIDVKTGGLCGGMVYTALDYYRNSQQIPQQNYRPAVQTELQDYIYDQQTRSLLHNLDKWTELGFNPFGARNSEFFHWGLRGFNRGRLQELREQIDAGNPVPLGLQSYGGKEGSKKRAGNHQVLAIGYDLGRYRGDLGEHKEDLKIFIYDPNYPKIVRILVPDVRTESYYYRDAYTDDDTTFKRWQAYFVDTNYRPQSPRVAASTTPPSTDELVRRLIIQVQTGDDDLRGGRDNLNVTLFINGEPSQTIKNINRGMTWINHYDQTMSIDLKEPVRAEAITRVVFNTTFSGGINGENWDVDYIIITATGGGVDLEIYKESGSPLFRFTGDRKTFTASTGREVPAMSLPAGAWRTGIDSAIFLKANRKNYFFKSGEYLRLSGTTVDTGYPQLLPGGWEGLPASWFSGIDAAIFLKSNGKNYFFKDNQYLRLTGTTVDEGYPQRLPGGWEGLPASWNSGIDAAFFLRSNGKNYFFKGNQYVRLTGTKVDPGYPVRLPGGWEGLPVSWYSGIDAAIFLRSNGKTYFFKGNEYVRLTGTKVDPGYPQRLPGGWKGLR